MNSMCGTGYFLKVTELTSSWNPLLSKYLVPIIELLCQQLLMYSSLLSISQPVVLHCHWPCHLFYCWLYCSVGTLLGHLYHLFANNSFEKHRYCRFDKVFTNYMVLHPYSNKPWNLFAGLMEHYQCHKRPKGKLPPKNASNAFLPHRISYYYCMNPIIFVQYWALNWDL